MLKFCVESHGFSSVNDGHISATRKVAKSGITRVVGFPLITLECKSALSTTLLYAQIFGELLAIAANRAKSGFDKIDDKGYRVSQLRP